MNVGDLLNFSWPSSSYDAVAYVQNDQVTLITSSGPLAIGSSCVFQASANGTLYYKSLTHGYLLNVTAIGIGAMRNGLTSRNGAVDAGKIISVEMFSQTSCLWSNGVCTMSYNPCGANLKAVLSSNYYQFYTVNYYVLTCQSQ